MLFLQHAEEFALQAKWNLSDLIEQQGAAVRSFKAARPILDGARKGTFNMAEELALIQIARHGSTIDSDERALVSDAEPVDFAGYEVLASAGLAQD